jgi:transposase
MANRRFEMYEYRQVIHRMRMGQSDRAIAKTKLMGRLKCGLVRAVAQERGWLDSIPLPDDSELARVFDPEKDSNPTRHSLSLSHEERIKKWVGEGIWATTIHRALVEQFGFEGSYSSVRRLIQRLRKGQAPRVTCILDFAPGSAAQVDFGKGPVITDVFSGEVIKTWIFVMTLCFSRHMYAEIVTNQKVETWLGCHRRAFEWFNGVPLKLIIDNTKCAITKACFYDPEVQRSYAELAEGYNFLISPCPPRDPEKKGRVEAGVKYVKNGFVPLREFRSLADSNEQLKEWVMGTAGNRIHGTTHEKPLTLFAETEKQMLQRLPDVAVELAVWAEAKLHGDCHVRFEKCFYSAPFSLAHRILWLKATDSAVKIYFNLELVATHPRLRKPGSRSTIDDHFPPEAIAYKTQDVQWCLRQSESIGPHCHELIRHLFSDRVLDNLRAAQGVIGYGKKYSAARLESACKRALFFGNPRRGAVKSILQKGLDQVPLENQTKTVALSSTYTGSGRFIRPASELQAR